MNQSISYVFLAMTGITSLALLAGNVPLRVAILAKNIPAKQLTSPQVSKTVKNVLCDLNGVLMDTKEATAANIIGLLGLIRIKLFGKLDPRELFFRYFDSILLRDPNSPDSCDEHGRPTPQLMIDWMIGARTGKEIYQFICNELRKNRTLKNHEKKAIRRFSKMLFGDPELFATTKKIVKRGVELVKECKQNGHRVFIISNWDSESIAVLRRKAPEFFELFDGVIISAEVGLLKPDEKIFQYALDTYGLDPADTILIDDQKENIDGAEKCGIAGIRMRRSGTPLLTKPDWKKAKAEFNAWSTQNASEIVKSNA